MNQVNPSPTNNNSPYQSADNAQQPVMGNVNTAPVTPTPMPTTPDPVPMSNTAAPAPASTANNDFSGIAHDTTPEVIEKETVIVKEKKVGGGGCTTFSLRSCCCWGCALLVLGFLLLVGFMYMVFFSNVSFFTNMRKQVSDRVDSVFTGEIPEYDNVSVSKYKNDIEDLDIENNTDLTMNLTEDEFNTLINQNIGNALNTDNTKDIEDLKAIANFTDKQAEVFIKVDKPALPTFKVIFTNDTSGKVTIGSAKVFGLNIDGSQLQDSLKDQAGDTISPNFLFETLVLGDKSDQFEAKEVYFSEGKIQLVFGVRDK